MGCYRIWLPYDQVFRLCFMWLSICHLLYCLKSSKIIRLNDKWAVRIMILRWWWKNEINYDITFHNNGVTRVLWSRAPWPITQNRLCESTKYKTQKEENTRGMILHIWSKPSQTFWQELIQWLKKLFQPFLDEVIVFAKPREKFSGFGFR